MSFAYSTNRVPKLASQTTARREISRLRREVCSLKSQLQHLREENSRLALRLAEAEDLQRNHDCVHNVCAMLLAEMAHPTDMGRSRSTARNIMLDDLSKMDHVEWAMHQSPTLWRLLANVESARSRVEISRGESQTDEIGEFGGDSSIVRRVCIVGAVFRLLHPRETCPLHLLASLFLWLETNSKVAVSLINRCGVGQSYNSVLRWLRLQSLSTSSPVVPSGDVFYIFDNAHQDVHSSSLRLPHERHYRIVTNRALVRVCSDWQRRGDLSPAVWRKVSVPLDGEPFLNLISGIRSSVIAGFQRDLMKVVMANEMEPRVETALDQFAWNVGRYGFGWKRCASCASCYSRHSRICEKCDLVLPTCKYPVEMEAVLHSQMQEFRTLTRAVGEEGGFVTILDFALHFARGRQRLHPCCSDVRDRVTVLRTLNVNPGLRGACASIIDEVAGELACGCSASPRTWFFVVTDGGPADAIWRMIMDGWNKHGIVPLLGPLHEEMMMLKTFLQVLGPWLLDDVLRDVVGCSQAAARSLLGCVDYHKSWEFFVCFLEAFILELACAFRHDPRTGNDDDWNKWVVQHPDDLCYSIITTLVIPWGLAILVFRAAVRTGNYALMRAARLSFAPLWFVSNHYKYCFYIAALERDYTLMPEEVRRSLELHWAVSYTGHTTKLEGMDAMIELVNKLWLGLLPRRASELQVEAASAGFEPLRKAQKAFQLFLHGKALYSLVGPDRPMNSSLVILLRGLIRSAALARPVVRRTTLRTPTSHAAVVHRPDILDCMKVGRDRLEKLVKSSDLKVPKYADKAALFVRVQ